MAYTKIGCGGSDLVHRGVLEIPNGSDHNARSPSSFPVISQKGNRRCVGTMSASVTDAVFRHAEMAKQGRSRGAGDRRAVELGREKLDWWMRDSVAEIVKNLSEAPLLVHVYGGGEGKTVVTKTEKAEEWEVVKGRWERGEAELPEGMIFVEELGGGGAAAEEGCGCGGGESEGTRAWGLVVQGKGVETGPVCYLLKTTRVVSGSGMRSTHFCLVRVSSFVETAEAQLRNCWIVGKGIGD